MTEEVSRTSAEIKPRPQKAITPSRDRWQSNLLAATLAVLISASIVFGLLATGQDGGLVLVTSVSIAFAAIVAAMRSATTGGAVCGALACFCLTWWSRDGEHPLLKSALPPLAALFVLTLLATRTGRKQKLLRGLAERSGGRDAAQVLANLGVAAVIVTPVGAYLGAAAGLTLPVGAPILFAASLAALAEATADTVSSEVGQALGTRTYMLTTFRRVHRGTDGGISIVGTGAGVLAALVVALIGGWSMHLPARAQALSWLAALIGFLFDSLLGATAERRGWIGNDVVNLASTAASSVIVLLMARLTPQSFQ